MKFVDGPLAGKQFSFDRPAPRFFKGVNGVHYRMERHVDGFYAFVQNDDSSTPVVAWRAWDPDREMLDRPLLKSMSDKAVWPINGPLVAQCRRLLRGNDEQDFIAEEHEHLIPEFDCSCGIWGTRTLHALGKAGYLEPEVFGLVSMAGKIIEHEDGYRAAQAYPLALVVNINIERGQWRDWLPPNWKEKIIAFTQALGDTYRVPCAATTPERASAMLVDLAMRGGLPRWTRSVLPTDLRRMITSP